jgi:hypothetical protein
MIVLKLANDHEKLALALKNWMDKYWTAAKTISATGR